MRSDKVVGERKLQWAARLGVSRRNVEQPTVSDLHQVLIDRKCCNRSLTQRHCRQKRNDQPIAIRERVLPSYLARRKCSIFGLRHELETDRIELSARDPPCTIGAWYRLGIDALRDGLEPRPVCLRTDQSQSQPQLVKEARDGRIATASAEMFDEGFDRVPVYPGFRREAKSFGIIQKRESLRTAHRPYAGLSLSPPPDALRAALQSKTSPSANAAAHND